MQKVSDIPEDGIMFYDIETDSQYCQYCNIKLIAYQVGLHSEPLLVEGYNREDFRRLLASNIMKVSFNGINFDDVVLMREGYYVNPTNRHDMYLAIKTAAPMLESFGLKAINWHFFRDWHEPARLLHNWCKRNSKMMWLAPKEILGNYCKHDVRQTVRVFKLVWEIVQRELHWSAYKDLEIAMGEPLHEMMLFGGEYINIAKTEEEINKLEKEKEGKVIQTVELSKLYSYDSKIGKLVPKRKDDFTIIYNPMSNKQVQEYFNVDHVVKAFLLGLDYGLESRDGNLKRPSRQSKGGVQGVGTSEVGYAIQEGDEAKDDPIKKLIRNVRELTKAIGYLRSYCEAAKYERNNRETRDRNFFVRQYSNFHSSNVRSGINKGGVRKRIDTESRQDSNGDTELIKIPKSYSLSGARTRRFISSSMFGINFQNQYKLSKAAQLVPKGWLGVFIDSTQIENVVHIWASHDDKRKAAYIADPYWNEYVWLCNEVLGTNYDKATLEGMINPINPAWSVYKQYKTGKLALNFGMGVKKFAKMTGLPLGEAEETFARIHRACPAIRQLQERVRRDLINEGRTRDAFGHIYTGSINQVYKVVSYLVQGCGTGSVPKAMTVACYNTIHEKDTDIRKSRFQVYHPYRRKYMFGVLCGTTHDELSLRISLALPTEDIVNLIGQLIHNMEDRFSDKFGDIPLRAKLAVSITTAAEQVELDHLADNFITRLVNDYIEVGKARDL